MKFIYASILIIFFLLPLTSIGQFADTTGSSGNISAKVADKYIGQISDRSSDYQKKMERGTQKYLEKLREKELVIKKQLEKIDPQAALRVFEESQKKYEQLQSDLKNSSDNVLKSCGKYIPGIDSAITSLKFLDQEGLAGKLGPNTAKVKDAMVKVKEFAAQLKKTDNVEEFIKERQQYLQQQLTGFKVPGLEQYNQQAAYYAQQMKEYKEAWEDPTKMEKKTIELLNKLPAFREFMEKNSLIAGLFNIPQDYSNSGVAGLQTREMVEQMMQQQMSVMGPSGSQSAQQSIGDAQSSLSTLRNKINQGSSELSMPDGKSNTQHTRSIFKRLVYGVDVQSSKSNGYFPNQTAFAGTAGYKINDKNTVGIGISYTVGWGKDIQHISISNQGIGFRSFFDFKIKGTYFGSGGFEYTYAYPFNSITQLRGSGLWQRSGLIGITKMVSIRSNLVKKTKLQILWNFLSYYQIPKTQPIVFRVGYNF